MIGSQTGFLVEHWPLALGAAAFGIAVALAYLAGEYLVAPAWRMRAAHRRGPGAVEALVTRERRRLGCLEDEAAVLGEHGRQEARELREEARLGRLIVSVMERRIGERRP